MNEETKPKPKSKPKKRTDGKDATKKDIKFGDSQRSWIALALAGLAAGRFMLRRGDS